MMFNSQIGKVTVYICLPNGILTWQVEVYPSIWSSKIQGLEVAPAFSKLQRMWVLREKLVLNTNPCANLRHQVGLYSQLGLCIVDQFMPCLVNLESPMAFTWDKVTWSCAKADSMSVAKVQRSCIHQQDTCSQELGKSKADSSPRKGDVHTSPKWDLIKASIRFY